MATAAPVRGRRRLVARDPRRPVRWQGTQGRRRADRDRSAGPGPRRGRRPGDCQGTAASDAERWIRTVHLIVDENPAPVAGVFHLFPQTGDATIATRIRVNQYTNLHAVAETSDGELYMVERFIKAAGGCSAPGLKDKATVMARLGQMKLKPLTAFAPGSSSRPSS